MNTNQMPVAKLGFQVGEHYLVEFYECDARVLNNEEQLRSGLLLAVERSGATIIKDVFHAFSPHGVTGVIVIAESHVSIHTWPEYHYAAVDIFTCSPKMNVQHIIQSLTHLIISNKVETTQISRGPRIKTPSS